MPDYVHGGEAQGEGGGAGGSFSNGSVAGLFEVTVHPFARVCLWIVTVKRKLHAVANFLSNCADNDRMRYLKKCDVTRVIISIKSFFLFYITKNKDHFFFRSLQHSFIFDLKFFTWNIYIYIYIYIYIERECVCCLLVLNSVTSPLQRR